MIKKGLNINVGYKEVSILIDILKKRAADVDKELDSLNVTCYSDDLSFLCYEKAFIDEMMYKIKLQS